MPILSDPRSSLAMLMRMQVEQFTPNPERDFKTKWEASLRVIYDVETLEAELNDALNNIRTSSVITYNVSNGIHDTPGVPSIMTIGTTSGRAYVLMLKFLTTDGREDYRVDLIRLGLLLEPWLK